MVEEQKFNYPFQKLKRPHGLSLHYYLTELVERMEK